MRQVFSSPRIENVEAVAQLLRQAGVEVRIHNGRGWRGAIRGNFSYREQPVRGAQPEIWVLRSEDYPKARQVLRDAGLQQGGHGAGGAFAGPSMHATAGERAAATRRPGSRARTGALLVVALAVGAGVLLLRWSASNAPPRSAPAVATGASPTASTPLIADVPAVHEIPTPPALASMLLAAEALALPDAACVSIDGQAAPASVTTGTGRVRSPDPCTALGPRIAIGPYRTDGMGTGTVKVSVERPGAEAVSHELKVERERDLWRILDTAQTAP